jgi:hypothetical protein
MNVEQHSMLHDTLDTLIDTYSDNQYVCGRLVNYIENILPSYLETALKTQEERKKRKDDLSSASEEFIKTFMLKHHYYYSSHNELFLNYDGVHFTGHSEDDIQHLILTQISANQTLRPWKYKINNKINRSIKERSPLKAIPESATIQYVLKLLHPTIFTSRNHAKYFLTIIGDCIRQVDKGLVYIASPVMKKLVREINVQIHTHFGISNALNAIKFKHYEHDYTQSRLLYIDNKSFTVPIDISQRIIDVLCVSCHYSVRYNTSSEFLKQCNEASLVEHVLYLHHNTPETIVKAFLKKCIQPCPHASITTKNMIFIWKKYLETINIPNIIFYESLINLLKDKLSGYDEVNDSFQNVTSASLPTVSSFLKFWDENMIEEPEELEIEIDEISNLFKNWTTKNYTGVEDTFLIELIRHFYPDIIVVDNKYVMNVKCKLWDKRQEVIDMLDLLKSEDAKSKAISLYVVYETYASQKKNPFIVSKRYFEKVAKEYLGSHLDGDGLISME